MIDLGIVKPGSTIRVPFSSFDKDDGSSVTMTNYAAADILIYKDGNTTARASTAGFTATTDFNSKTGKHLAVIDLADNTTAGFFNAGSEYLVAIDAVTVDGVTTGGWIARFVIGYPDADLNTTIASLSSQTSFTLTTGPAEDDALNGCVVAIHDIASAVQMGYAVVADYTGSTKTVTLTNGVTFTAAAGDNISIFSPGNARWFAALLAVELPLVPTTAGRKLDVSAGGEAGLDWANIGSPTTAQNLSGTNIDTDQVVASVTGAVGSVTGAVGSVTGNVGGNVTGSVGSLAAQAKADVNAEADAAIETYHLDHLLAVTYDPASKPGAADALLNELVESDGGVARFTANALEQAPTGGSAPTAEAIADEVQTRTIAAVTLVNGLAANTVTASALAADAVTEIQSGLATAAELAKVPKSDGTATWNATALAAIQSEANDALVAYDPPTRAEATSDKDEVLAAVGEVPTNAELATALDPLPTAAENAAALLAAAVEGAVTVLQSLRLANAALGGKASGLETTTATYRDLADTKDRLVATVDADGNRTAVTRDLT